MLNIDKNEESCLILGIETSCDETSAAVVSNGRNVLSNIISSQIDVHQKYGGVVPEIASRKHIENIMSIIDRALTEAKASLADISAIGVTHGPGLVGALLVGVSAAKALAFAADRPLIGVNHLEGHIYANFLANQELEPPFVALVVSGGHTSLVYVSDYNSFKLLGQTRDDAAGEAFDKIARVMNLPYPGGPYIDKLAMSGNPQAINFPRAFSSKDNFEFSFSGLKSAALNYLNGCRQRGDKINMADIAASFQAAIVDVLVSKALQAAEYCSVKKIVLAGGVAANSQLKKQLYAECETSQIKLYYPPQVFCTDNAAMIASRAYYKYMAGIYADLNLNAFPSLNFGN